MKATNSNWNDYGIIFDDEPFLSMKTGHLIGYLVSENGLGLSYVYCYLYWYVYMWMLSKINNTLINEQPIIEKKGP